MTAPGSLLGGRVRHEQLPDGHRTGIEPVLLAASIPARAGQRVLEAGSGAGAALLCLAWRVPRISGLGVEREAALAALARENAEVNGFAGLSFAAQALEDWADVEKFDHAFANPPWHAPGTESPDRRREAARRARPGLFADWTQRLAAALRPRGTLTLVVAADHFTECLAALDAAGCGGLSVLPLWPKAGRAARLVLLRGIKGSRATDRLLPGLVLHAAQSGYTAEATAILREGAPLAF